ncbi:hypothetical protein L1887_11714 [Cichorium endivia]|nr:hypothetical protein L1887_11714 [Cichorium endivia]
MNIYNLPPAMVGRDGLVGGQRRTERRRLCLSRLTTTRRRREGGGVCCRCLWSSLVDGGVGSIGEDEKRRKVEEKKPDGMANGTDCFFQKVERLVGTSSKVLCEYCTAKEKVAASILSLLPSTPATEYSSSSLHFFFASHLLPSAIFLKLHVFKLHHLHFIFTYSSFTTSAYFYAKEKKAKAKDDDCFEIVSDEDNTKQDGTLNSFVKKQTTMNQATKNREPVVHALCRLLYGEALSFNLVKSPLWKDALKKVGEYDDEWITETEDVCLPEDISWMDVHECFKEDEGTSSNKRKRGPRNLNKVPVANDRGKTTVVDTDTYDDFEVEDYHEGDEVGLHDIPINEEDEVGPL